MSKLTTYALVCAFSLLTGCGIRLRAVDPSKFEVASDLKTSLDTVYSTDSGYASHPQDWIGRVGIVRATKPQGSNNLSCSAKGTIEWVSDRVGDTSSLDYNPVNQEKKLRFKQVVDQKFAANIDAMKYLTQQLSGNVIFKVLLTQLSTQSALPGQKWRTALDNFQTSKKALYFEPSDICYVFVVGGYVSHVLTREMFRKIEGKTAGGYAGINVNGEYYGTDDQFAMDDLFALSLEILRRPPNMGSGDGVARNDEERKPGKSDRNFLSEVASNSTQNLGKWEKATYSP